MNHKISMILKELDVLDDRKSTDRKSKKTYAI